MSFRELRVQPSCPTNVFSLSRQIARPSPEGSRIIITPGIVVHACQRSPSSVGLTADPSGYTHSRFASRAFAASLVGRDLNARRVICRNPVASSDGWPARRC
jgi:hypothetical protein